MDKNKLIAVLAYKLEESGVKREIALAEARAFTGSLSDEEAGKLVSLVENDAMMNRIAATLKKKVESAAAARQTAPAPKTAENVQVRQNVNNSVSPIVSRENIGRDQRPARELPPAAAQQRKEAIPQTLVTGRETVPTRETAHQEHQPAARPAGEAAPQRRVPPAQAPVRRPENGSQAPRTAGSTENAPEKRTAPVRRREANNDKKIIYRPDPNADYKKFYIILGCSSPIWVLVGLAGITLFLLVLGALCVATVLLILALVAGTAVGTVLSLVGIVYGITQLFNYAPIGLYEIGLGLMIGGGTMLLGIIAYNIAIRLIPFLIKQLFALFMFTVRKCVELYFYLKGACADL